jgi:hypothetical protein
MNPDSEAARRRFIPSSTEFGSGVASAAAGVALGLGVEDGAGLGMVVASGVSVGVGVASGDCVTEAPCGCDSVGAGSGVADGL